MFYSRATSDFLFLAIMSETKLMLYEVCEDDTCGCDKNFLFQIDFNDDQNKQYGNPISADFSSDG